MITCITISYNYTLFTITACVYICVWYCNVSVQYLLVVDNIHWYKNAVCLALPSTIMIVYHTLIFSLSFTPLIKSEQYWGHVTHVKTCIIINTWGRENLGMGLLYIHPTLLTNSELSLLNSLFRIIAPSSNNWLLHIIYIIL